MSHYLRTAAMFCSLGIVAGCSVTSEKIQKWKTTQRGPDKLRSALRDADLSSELRGEAALALADIGLVAPLAEDLAGLSAADRAAVGQKVVGHLVARLKGGAAGTTDAQLRAKDALFGLRSSLGDEQQRLVDGALVPWLLADWSSRARGEHSAEKIIRAAPPELAGPLLVEAVTKKPALVVVLAEQVRRVGRATDREAAAAKLVALAKSQAPASARTLEALGRVGAAASRAHLLEIGGSSTADLQRRVGALQALSLDPERASVPVLARLAGSAKQPDPVRGAAFQALEAIAGPATIKVLARIIRTDRNDTVRFRAVEALIRCCGTSGLPELLESLPREYTYTRSDVADFLEADIKGLGAKALPMLRKALGGQSWIARLVAIRVLADLGTPADIEALEKLRSDATKLKGWEAGATIGREAATAADRLRQRN